MAGRRVSCSSSTIEWSDSEPILPLTERSRAGRPFDPPAAPSGHEKLSERGADDGGTLSGAEIAGLAVWIDDGKLPGLRKRGVVGSVF